MNSNESMMLGYQPIANESYPFQARVNAVWLTRYVPVYKELALQNELVIPMLFHALASEQHHL